MMPELLEVIRFQKEELDSTPPLRIRGRWYGDYPFRTDKRLKVPQSIYRLKHEFSMGAGLDDVRVEGGEGRHLAGTRYVNGIAARGRGRSAHHRRRCCSRAGSRACGSSRWR